MATGTLKVEVFYLDVEAYCSCRSTDTHPTAIGGLGPSVGSATIPYGFPAGGVVNVALNPLYFSIGAIKASDNRATILVRIHGSGSSAEWAGENVLFL